MRKPPFSFLAGIVVELPGFVKVLGRSLTFAESRLYNAVRIGKDLFLLYPSRQVARGGGLRPTRLLSYPADKKE